MYRIGVDLGGTNISVGVVDSECNIIGRASVKTKAPRPAEEIFEDMTVWKEMFFRRLEELKNAVDTSVF